MKTQEGLPMPGAKRKNQNAPNGGKEKKLLVLPDADKIAIQQKPGRERRTSPGKSRNTGK